MKRPSTVQTPNQPSTVITLARCQQPNHTAPMDHCSTCGDVHRNEGDQIHLNFVTIQLHSQKSINTEVRIRGLEKKVPTENMSLLIPDQSFKICVGLLCLSSAPIFRKHGAKTSSGRAGTPFLKALMEFAYPTNTLKLVIRDQCLKFGNIPGKNISLC